MISDILLITEIVGGRGGRVHIFPGIRLFEPRWRFHRDQCYAERVFDGKASPLHLD